MAADRAPLLIVGAGFSGAVIARRLAEAGYPVELHDARDHVAGNCHTERDPETGVMVHRYGPHIFHTGDAEVWDYVTGFTTFRPYDHKVRSIVGDRVYSLPVNLLTINQFFGTTMGPEEARAFVESRAAPFRGGTPANFEEQALSLIGPDLYEAFFKGYTVKQWGLAPSDLPASIFRRLPLRFTYEDGYFNHPYQGIPEAGYTALVSAILDHPGVEVHLSSPVSPETARAAIAERRHTIWTGPLDRWFGHDAGWLGYRTLDFEPVEDPGEGQGCAVMNYGDPDVPWTRITEHRHFAPWEQTEGTVLMREYSRLCGPEDIPYYPIRLADEKALLGTYVARAGDETGVTFVGRLGTYRYLDMDVTIREALDTAQELIAAFETGGRPPVFSRPPL